MGKDELSAEIDQRLSQRNAGSDWSDVMLTVTLINNYIRLDGQANYDLPYAGVIEKLKAWIKKLIEQLMEIAKEHGKGVSFSISAGMGGVSVTVNFPPVESGGK